MFETKDIKKIYLNAKVIFKFLTKNNVKFCDNFSDIHLADYLINSENNLSFSNIVQRHNIHGINIDLLDMDSDNGVICYLIETSRSLIEINKKQQIILEKENLMSLFMDVEKPLVKVLLHMESNGVCIDTSALNNYSDYLTREITVLTEQIYQLPNQSFNIASPKQLVKFYFKN